MISSKLETTFKMTIELDRRSTYILYDLLNELTSKRIREIFTDAGDDEIEEFSELVANLYDNLYQWIHDED